MSNAETGDPLSSAAVMSDCTGSRRENHRRSCTAGNSLQLGIEESSAAPSPVFVKTQNLRGFAYFEPSLNSRTDVINLDQMGSQRPMTPSNASSLSESTKTSRDNVSCIRGLFAGFWTDSACLRCFAAGGLAED